MLLATAIARARSFAPRPTRAAFHSGTNYALVNARSIRDEVEQLTRSLCLQRSPNRFVMPATTKRHSSRLERDR